MTRSKNTVWKSRWSIGFDVFGVIKQVIILILSKVHKIYTFVFRRVNFCISFGDPNIKIFKFGSVFNQG